MKSLLLACLFFGVLVWGCYDVIPFKPLRRVVRLVWGCYDVIPFKPLRRVVRRTPRAAPPEPRVEEAQPTPAPLRARRR